MVLEGIHHVTAITGDAPRNVEFYVGTMGLRLVKKSVNQDDPTVYHLFYADEKGSPGSDLTFFEYPGAAPGRAGPGMIHRVVWRVSTEAALDFWEQRLELAATEIRRASDNLTFSDPEGLGLELRIDSSGDPPLRAAHPDIPEEFAITGFDGVRAFTSDPHRSESLLGETLGFSRVVETDWTVRGTSRSSFYVYDDPPAGRDPE